jgi:hypothetical protein
MVVVSLVEKNILPIFALGRVIFEGSVPADAVLHAQLLPKLISDCQQSVFYEHLLWLPHYPTYKVIISLGILRNIKLI